MNRAGSIWALAGLVAGLAAGAAGQKAEPTPLPTAAAAAAPLRLTLGTAPLRATMERWRVSWLYPASLPDVRLKVDRPAWTDPSENESESRLRAVEFRLPLEGWWVGYETPSEGEEPRATFSIQQKF